MGSIWIAIIILMLCFIVYNMILFQLTNLFSLSDRTVEILINIGGLILSAIGFLWAIFGKLEF